jgi:hypothetical protein
MVEGLFLGITGHDVFEKLRTFPISDYYEFSHTFSSVFEVFPFVYLKNQMITFLPRLCFIAMLLFLGKPVSADEEIPKENPLPQRETPVPHIEGYADWKFTDSIETLHSDDRLMFIEAGEETCEFGKEEKRDKSTWPDCFYHTSEIFQEPAEIFILATKQHIERILIHFNRLGSKSDSKDCASVMNVVVDNLVKKFGVPTGKNESERQVFWESPYGGTLEFTNNCISEDRGLVLFAIFPASVIENPEP